MILQQDGLRTPTLLARDAANLAVALCASAEQMDGAWRTLAARAGGGEGFAGSTAEGGCWVGQGGGGWKGQRQVMWSGRREGCRLLYTHDACGG